MSIIGNKNIPAPFKWYGGKGRLITWITNEINNVSHKIFVDAFGGAGNIILNKNKVPIEVYNDLNGYLVNFYRVLQDDNEFIKLQNKINLTLYSRNEFALALKILKEPIPQDNTKPDYLKAWAIFIAYNQGFSGKANTIGDWGRVKTTSTGVSKNVKDYRNKIELLDTYHERIKYFQIDNRDAIEVAKTFDSEETLIYFDPPYPENTRKKTKDYKHELSLEKHQELSDWCKTAKSKIFISSYKSDIYDNLGWDELTKEYTLGMGNSNLHYGNSKKNNVNNFKRIECLYTNVNLKTTTDTSTLNF